MLWQKEVKREDRVAMGKTKPDGRSEYQMLGTVDGYDRWALTYDNPGNPLIALEQPVLLSSSGFSDISVLSLSHRS